MEDADLARVVDVNLQAAFALCRAVVPMMKAAGFGRIINIASIAGRDAGRLSGPIMPLQRPG
ncbi:SDR family NAD(P)-dependent oxidoreductase [Gemmobacter lanyuensis]